MITKRDTGRWVRIRFWDHCITNQRTKKKKPIECEVAGMIREVNNLRVVLATWWLHGEDKSTQRENQESFEIVRSCIIKYGWCEVLKWNDD